MTIALPPGCGPEVLELLAELIYVPLSTLDLGNWFDLAPLGEDGLRLAHSATFAELCALGGALRASPAAAERAQLNLLDPESVLGQAPKWGALLGVRLLGGVSAVGIAAGIGLSAGTTAYRSKADAIEAELNGLRVAEAANPPSLAVKELEALRQKEAQQRQMQDTLLGSMTGSSQGYSDYLMALGRRIHPAVWITGMTVVGDGRDVMLTGRTVNPQALPQYLQGLASEERFQGRRFAQLNIATVEDDGMADGVVQFTLRSALPMVALDGKSAEQVSRDIVQKREDGKK
jgi:hypothetical protein